MKKLFILTLLVLAVAPKASAQCQESTALPYTADIESAALSSLPECMEAMWDFFSSQEMFETIEAPVPGFTGKILAYDTTINTEFGMPANAAVGSRLYTPLLPLVQGTAYTISFRYGNSDPNLTIDLLSIALNSMGETVEIDDLGNITGATATDYVSAEFTPPSTGDYAISLAVVSEGTQGLLYLDDISVQSLGVMGTEDRMLSGVSLYPNPAKSVVTLSNITAIDAIELYNSTGQLLLAETPKAALATLDLSILASGMYIAHIRSGAQLEKKKIIKE